MIRRIERLIEILFHMDEFYRIDELTHQGHCGCCGRVVQDVLERSWAIGLCGSCIAAGQAMGEVEGR